jgi:hypothetical protein
MVVPARGGKTALRKGRVLASIRKNNGYLCVTLAKGSVRVQVALHRLVARAFLGECPIGLHVLHTDGDKNNNRVDNLRYGTPAENIADTERHGKRRKGSRHPLAKLDEDAVQTIRSSGRSCREVAEWFGVSAANVSAVRRRRIWRHL